MKAVYTDFFPICYFTEFSYYLWCFSIECLGLLSYILMSSASRDIFALPSYVLCYGRCCAICFLLNFVL